MSKKRIALMGLLVFVLLVTACEGDVTEAPPPETPESSPVPTSIPSGAACVSVPPVTEDDWIRGPADAPITVIEYAEFECPACARYKPELQRVLDAYGDDIRLVYRFFPLPYHDKALITAEAAEAAGAQGAFWEMHDLLYERAEEWAEQPVDGMLDVLVGYAGELDLDVDAFRQALEEHTYLAEVEAAYEEAVALRIPGTPTFIVNGRMVPLRTGIPLDVFIDLTQELDAAYDSPPPQVLDPQQSYQAVIETEKGEIVVELFTDQVPDNVNQFAFLAQEGRYDDNPFFHVIPDQVAVTGDPTGTGFVMDHGYWCDAELAEGIDFGEAGLVGLVNATQQTTSNQFFITLTPESGLGDTFTIIGRVVEGMDVLQSLTPRDNREQEPGPADVIETIRIEEIDG